MAIGSIVLSIIFIGVLIAIVLLVRNVILNLRAIRRKEDEMIKNLNNVEDETKETKDWLERSNCLVHHCNWIGHLCLVHLEYYKLTN